MNLPFKKSQANFYIRRSYMSDFDKLTPEQIDAMMQQYGDEDEQESSWILDFDENELCEQEFDAESAVDIDLPELQESAEIVASPTDESQTGKPCPRLISAVQILREPDEPIKWIVDGILPNNTITMLAAPPGNLKTYFALAMGIKVSKGATFLGKDTTKTRVVYIDQENPKFVIKNRLRKIGGSSNFYVWHYEDKAPYFIGGSDIYKKMATEPTLLIFDSFVRFHEFDENQSWLMKKVTAALREIVRNDNITILILHHAGKNKGEGSSYYRGSSEIEGGVDVAYRLLADKENHKLTLICEKNRLVEEETFKIGIKSDDTTFALENISQQEKEAYKAQQRDLLTDIKALLTDRIKESGTKLKTGDFVDLIRSHTGLSPDKCKKKIEEGMGKLWTMEKRAGSGNAKLFEPID